MILTRTAPEWFTVHVICVEDKNRLVIDFTPLHTHCDTYTQEHTGTGTHMNTLPFLVKEEDERDDIQSKVALDVNRLKEAHSLSKQTHRKNHKK